MSRILWSPDGTKIAYTCSDPESHVGSNGLRHERGWVRIRTS